MLQKWTGWTDYEIAYLVRMGVLKRRKLHRNARWLYVVQSAQDIIDG
jgi:hypothetical protein